MVSGHHGRYTHHCHARARTTHSTVIAGLDPAIHETTQLTLALRKIFFAEAGSWTRGSSPRVTPFLLIYMGNFSVPSFNSEFTVQFE